MADNYFDQFLGAEDQESGVDTTSFEEPEEENYFDRFLEPESTGPGYAGSAVGAFARDLTSSLLSSPPKALGLALADVDANVIGRFNSVDENFGPGQGVGEISDVGSFTSDELTDLYAQANLDERKQIRQNVEDVIREAKEGTLYKSGEAIDQYVAERLPINPEYSEKWGVQVAGGLGSVLGFLGASLVTRGVGGAGLKAAGAGASKGAQIATAATGGAATGSALNYAAEFEDALARGASLSEAFRTTEYSGYVGALEVVPVLTFLERIDKVSGGAIKKALVRMLAQGTEEAIQEGTAQVLNNVGANSTYDPERNVLEGLGPAAGMGFSVGTIVEAIGTLMPGRRARVAQGEPGAEPGAGPDESPTDRAKRDLNELDRGFEESESVAAAEETRSLEALQAEARQRAAAAGGDALDMELAAAEVALDLSDEMAATAEGRRTFFNRERELAEQRVETAKAEEKAAKQREQERKAAAVKPPKPTPAPVKPQKPAPEAPTAQVKPQKLAPAAAPETGVRETTVSKDIGQAEIVDAATLPEAEANAAVLEAANQAASSPTNALKEPRKGAPETAYPVGEVAVQGFNLEIENAPGTERRGRLLTQPYGRFKDVKGADGERLDVFVGPKPKSKKVFVIDQVDKNGRFDEHKVMLGYPNQLAAVRAYKSNYDEGHVVGPVTEMTIDEFNTLTASGVLRSPVSPQLQEPRGREGLKAKRERQGLQMRLQPRKGVRQGKPMTQAEAQERVDVMLESLPGLKKIVHVVQRPQDLPAAEINSMPAEQRQVLMEGRVPGFIKSRTGQIYIVADANRSTATLIKTVLHEGVGHMGVSLFNIGKKKLAPSAIHKEVFDSITKTDNALMDRIVATYELDLKNEADRRTAGDEYIAHLAENPGADPTVWRKVVAKVREILRDMGIVKKWTDDDIRQMLRRSADYLQRERPVEHAKLVGLNRGVIGPEALVMKVTSKKRQEPAGRKPWRRPKKTVLQHMKASWDKWMKAAGNLPDQVFKRKIERDSHMRVEEMHIRHLLTDLDRAIKKEFGKSHYRIDDAIKIRINDYLAGNQVMLPAAVKEAADKMRAYLDRLSGLMIKSGVIENEETVKTVLGNIGKYLNRSYRAFDDPRWPKTVPDDIRRDAYQYLEKRLRDTGALKGMTEKKIEGRINGIINNILESGTAADKRSSLISEWVLGQKDLSILMRRKDIAEPIRRLLGEYQDPRVNFTRSAIKMERAIMNHEFLKTVFAEGKDVFLFDKPTGEFSVPLEGASGKTFGPLQGMYTTPEIRDSFRHILDKNNMNAFWRQLIGWNSVVKYNKTVVSPTTVSRNFLSASFFSIGNGHFWMFYPKEMKKAFMNVQRDLRSRSASREYMKKMIRLGVVYDNPHAGELIGVLKDFTQDEGAFAKNLISGKARTFVDFLTRMYQAGDDFWKIVGFEIESARLEPEMGREAAEALAAERIRGAYPTYSLLGRAIKWLRKFPLMGTFVSFPAAIVVSSTNIMRYTAQDIAAGRTKAAWQRVTGMAMAAGFAAAARSISMAISGLDDEDDEAIRMMGPPWSRNSDLVYVGYDKDGLPEYFDVSFLDPYNYLKRPINALVRGTGDWKEQFTSALKDMTDPFFGRDIAFGAILDIVNNKKETGGQVYNPEDSVPQQQIAILDHFRKAVQPGVFGNLERISKAAMGDTSRYGKKYKLEDELWAVGGFRKSTLNPLQSISFKAYEFGQRKQDATRILTYVVGGQNRVGEDEIRSAFGRMLDARQDAYEDMIQYADVAQAMGLPTTSIFKILKASGASQKDAAAIVKGIVPKWTPSSSFMESARDRAIETSPSAERKKEILGQMKERLSIVEELFRDQFTGEL